MKPEELVACFGQKRGMDEAGNALTFTDIA